MRFVLKVDKNDEIKSADIRDLTACEMLVINSALRRYSQDEGVHEEDRAMADRLSFQIIGGASHPSRPIEFDPIESVMTNADVIRAMHTE